MTKCGYCSSRIFIGGVTAGGQKFCNNKCHQSAYVLSLSRQVPANILAAKVEEVFRGSCPKCKSAGPVDVHKFHQVWSILVLTRWTSAQQLSCRSCAIKRQAGAAAFSLVCGWWGFPWGLILTPVQIGRNIAAMASSSREQPSKDLHRMVLVGIGQQMLARPQHKPVQAPPVIAA